MESRRSSVRPQAGPPVRLIVGLVALALSTTFALHALVVRSARAADAPPAAAPLPGDDFFAYANAAWLAKASIPAGKHRWNARDEIDVSVKSQLDTALLETATNPTTPHARQVAAFRAAWLDVAAIDAKGNAPLASSFAQIDRIRDRGALSDALGRLQRADVSPLNWGIYSSKGLFGLAVEHGTHGQAKPVALLLQGGLGLADRDAYLADTPDARAQREGYARYVATILAAAGFDRADARAANVVALETKVAAVHATDDASTPEANADHVWARGDFAKKAPGMDWSRYFAAAGIARRESLVAWQPDAVVGQSALVASEDLETWKDWLRARTIDLHAQALPQPFRSAESVLRGDVPRDRGAVAALNATVPDVVGHVYVDRWFPATSKAKVQTIANAVRSAFQKRIAATTWMDDATKRYAVAKLDRTYIGIGYPERWPDIAAVSFDPRDAYGNVDRADAVAYRRALAALDRPFDPTVWVVGPHVPTVLIDFLGNAYYFPASFLQKPKFDADASLAAQFGTMGPVFGHELSHTTDKLGAAYETSGAMAAWWGKDVDGAFERAAAPLVTQVAAYTVAGTAVNGPLAESESVADLAGLATAFDAYRTAVGPLPEAERRGSDRDFFLAYAHAWVAKSDDEGLRVQARSDHPPEAIRISTIRNLDAWYDAFDVRPGQRLYLAPTARVGVW